MNLRYQLRAWLRDDPTRGIEIDTIERRTIVRELRVVAFARRNGADVVYTLTVTALPLLRCRQSYDGCWVRPVRMDAVRTYYVPIRVRGVERCEGATA